MQTCRADESEIARIAYHEAAHAVFVLEHPKSGRLLRLRIERKKGSCVYSPSCRQFFSRERQRICCMQLLAGREAELFFFGSAIDETSESDRQEVITFLQTVPPPNSRQSGDYGFWKYYNSLEEQTTSFVVEHKQQIETLAKALLKHRRMNGAQASLCLKTA